MLVVSKELIDLVPCILSVYAEAPWPVGSQRIKSVRQRSRPLRELLLASLALWPREENVFSIQQVLLDSQVDVFR